MTTPGRPTIWDRIDQGSERLLGLPPRGVLDPGTQDMARRQGLLALGSSLLQSSQPTVEPNSFSAALGKGLEAGRQGAGQGAQTGLALQQQAQQQQIVAARSGIFQKYSGQMNDPNALRQAANELAALGDMDGAKLMSDMADSMTPTAAKAPPQRVGTLATDPPGTRPYLMERDANGNWVRAQGTQGAKVLDPFMSQEASAFSTLQSGYSTEMKPYIDTVEFVGNTLDYVDKRVKAVGEKAALGDAALQIALARAFADATSPEAARFRADANIWEGAQTLLDQVDDMWKHFISTGEVSLLPDSQVPNILALMRDVQRRNEQRLRTMYGRWNSAMERFGIPEAERPTLPERMRTSDTRPPLSDIITGGGQR